MSNTNLKVYPASINILFKRFKMIFVTIIEAVPPIMIPIVPIIIPSRKIIFNICPSVVPILFNIAYSFFLSFIVIKKALYSIIINKIEKIPNIIPIIIFII